jgi:hypothetical protein
VTPEVEDEQRKIVKDSQPLSSRRQQRSWYVYISS